MLIDLLESSKAIGLCPMGILGPITISATVDNGLHEIFK